jgi:CDP-glycerol glycerophosphotransferase (TagB/SpsB family)
MGFGEVVRTVEELVGAIEQVIRSDCRMSEEYQKRVDDFFTFTDRNNCKRVYETICTLRGSAA